MLFIGLPHTHAHSLHRMVSWGLAKPYWLRQIGLERLEGGVGWWAGWGGRQDGVAGLVGWLAGWGG